MTQDSTMALGADFIDNLFYKTEETVEHSGVKGMKWGKRKKDQLSTKPSSTIDEMLNKFSETAAEAAARQKMVDDYIKIERGKGTDKKAGGKSGGAGGKKKGGGKSGGSGGKKKGGGGRKKGGAKKKSSGRSGRSSDNGSSSSRAEVSRPTYKFSNSYAPRRAISDILASVPKNLGPRKPNARVQAIIDKINASVDAKKALQNAILDNSEDPETLEDIIMHYGVLGMKWGVRKDRQMNAMGAGGGGEIDQEALIAEMVAKGLTMDEILKQIQDTFGGAAKTIEDIQKTIQDYMDHPFESPQERQWRHNRERLEKEDEQRRKEDAEKQKQDEANRREDEANGGRIWYDPWGFPTTNQNMPNHPAPRKVAHSEEGGAMSGASEELVAVDSMDDILAHYGVLGMKWGVRKDDRGNGRPQGGPSKKKAPLASLKKAITPKKSDTSETSGTKVMGVKKFVHPTTGKIYTITYDTNKLKMNDDGTWQAADEKTAEEFKALMKQNGIEEFDPNPSVTVTEDIKPETKRSDGAMSDQELRDVINRLQMEKTYKQLMAERNPPPVKKAESAIAKILRDSTRQAAGEILKGTLMAVGKYAIAAAISKKNPTLANAIMKTATDNGKKKNESNDSTDSTDSEPFKASPSKSSQNSRTSKSSSGLSDAGKQKIVSEMDSNPRTSPSLDLGPTPQQYVDPKDVESAYNRAIGALEEIRKP